MGVAIVTGSAGLIGSESVRFFANLGMDVIGFDNDLRRHFFGDSASTEWNRLRLEREVASYRHYTLDIRDQDAVNQIYKRYGPQISLIIHTAAQPSHDWAAREPHTDFSVNATGTLNLLEAVRHYAPQSVFIFTSTNKVYGNTPNRLPLVETTTRWELEETHPYYAGIPEEMSIDQTLHSLFGASKVAADVLVQEYGHYFELPTACFRCGCLTGPKHAGAQLHGFLAYLMKCTATGTPYTVYGYQGKQVRDNIHSADLVRAFYEFYLAPRIAEVYNMGGGRHSNCSMLEAIAICEQITGRPLTWRYLEEHRMGDHMWWISSLSKFQQHYPTWTLTYDIPAILHEIYVDNKARWQCEVKTLAAA